MCKSVAYLDLMKTDENGLLIKTGFTAIEGVDVFEDGSVDFTFDDRHGGYYIDHFTSKQEAIAFLDKIKAFIEAN